MIISYYTKNTIYEREVEDLLSTCLKLHLDHYIVAKEDLGSWERNCCEKPLFILECLQKFQKPLFWVDADAMILQKPSFYWNEYDVGFYFQDEQDHARAGTIYASYTKATLDFLRSWHLACQERFSALGQLPGADQAILNELLYKKPLLKIAKLPVEYVRIFDRDPIAWEKTVILHFQASRTARMDPLLWQHLTGLDLKHLRMSQRFSDTF